MKGLTRRFAAVAAAFGAASISGAALLTIGQSNASAAVFGQQEVDQNRYIAVSVPRGEDAYGLVILEQVADTPQCWSESGANPTLVDPLLVNFDFTGICGRSTDSNGYSIRANGRDLGLRYNLRVIRRQDDVRLLGVPNDDKLPTLEIGRTNGITRNVTRILLNPGWRFTRRTLENRPLGHVYLTYEGPLPDGVIPPFTFVDVDTDIYATEIQSAVNVGFISGFEDNTFRPTDPLTREQLVSMVLDALKRLPNVNLELPTQTGAAPYSDVVANRWSAAKIQFAKERGIVSGYEDGTFRPTQPVTRAELVAVLRRAAQFGLTLSGKPPELQPNKQPTIFADTATHWSANLVTEMSAYCGVASAFNERGNIFAPDTAAQRNYAAAATLRAFNCIQAPSASIAPAPAPAAPGLPAPDLPAPAFPAPSAPAPASTAPNSTAPNSTVPNPTAPAFPAPSPSAPNQ